MPIYEYECPNCGRYDVWQPFEAKPLERCRKCNSKVQRVFSPPTIIWKGRALTEELDAAAEEDARHPVARSK